MHVTSTDTCMLCFLAALPIHIISDSTGLHGDFRHHGQPLQHDTLA